MIKQCAKYLLIVITCVITGCVTCGSQTDPYKLSTMELLACQSALDDYLVTQRSYLQSLQGRLVTLDDDLLTSQAELFKIKGLLDKASIPQKELKAIRQQMAELKQQSTALGNQIIAGEIQIEELQQSLTASLDNRAETEQALEREKQRVADMEAILKIVQDGVKEVAAIGLKYAQG